MFFLIFLFVHLFSAQQLSGAPSSCDSNSIPYQISVDGTGKPEIYCIASSCLISDSDEIICNEFSEIVCDGTIQWTGGLHEINNGTHRTLKTQCCNYSRLKEAEKLKTIILDDGEMYTGGHREDSDGNSGFDLIKEVRKKVDWENKVQYIVTVARLQCTGINRKFGYDSLQRPEQPHTSRRNNRKFLASYYRANEYEDEIVRRRHPISRYGSRRRAMRPRPLDDYYYIESEYEQHPRSVYRSGYTQAKDNYRLWPVKYETASRILGEQTYSGVPVYNPNLPSIQGGSSSSDLNTITEDTQSDNYLPVDTQTSSSIQVVEVQQANSNLQSISPPQSSQAAGAVQQQPNYPIPPPQNTYQYANYVQDSYRAPVVQQPAVQAVQPPVQQYYSPSYSYPSYSYSSGTGYSGGAGLNNLFSNMQCFSGEAKVETPAGTKVMKDLQIGDLVMTVEDSAVLFSPIILFLHKVDDEVASFVQLTMMTGDQLNLTEYHLIYITPCIGNDDLKLVPAKDVKLGDCVYTVARSNKLIRQEVVNITKVTNTGIYAPLTTSGDIVVNNVLASCHSNLALKTLQQTYFLFYRYVHSIYHYFIPESSGQYNLPVGVTYLTSVLDVLLPTSLIS